MGGLDPEITARMAVGLPCRGRHGACRSALPPAARRGHSNGDATLVLDRRGPAVSTTHRQCPPRWRGGGSCRSVVGAGAATPAPLDFLSVWHYDRIGLVVE